VANLDAFVATRGPSWGELETLVRAARNRPARLGADGVRRLGTLYREAAADLAIARRAYPGTPVVARLEELVRRARDLVYTTGSAGGTLREFVSHGYWRRVRERPLLLVCAIVLFFVPAFLAGYWAWRDPGAASGLVPGQFQSVTEPRTPGQDLGLSVDEQADMSAQIFTNNIRVTMLAFAGGMLFGLGTVFMLLYNGVVLGAVAGLAIGAGNGRPFFELVTAHGVLELSCIAVGGLAGLRLASGIVDPGNRPRSVALREEARAAVELVLGTAAWLVVAGLVEGFVTPAGTGLTTVLVVGFGLGVLYWGLVWWRGKPQPLDARPP
jgi:uncharacterized membrane protein SpoIIM required for sporulation